MIDTAALAAAVEAYLLLHPDHPADALRKECDAVVERAFARRRDAAVAAAAAEPPTVPAEAAAAAAGGGGGGGESQQPRTTTAAKEKDDGAAPFVLLSAFEQVYSDSGSRGARDVSIWRPVLADGAVCLGYLVK